MSDDKDGERQPPQPVATAPGESDWAALQRAVTDKGIAGDTYSAWVALQMRLANAASATIDLPPADDAAGLEKAQAAVIAAMGRPLTPRNAMIYSTLLENRRRAMTTRDLEARLTAIEEANRARAKSGWRDR